MEKHVSRKKKRNSEKALFQKKKNMKILTITLKKTAKMEVIEEEAEEVAASEVEEAATEVVIGLLPKVAEAEVEDVKEKSITKRMTTDTNTLNRSTPSKVRDTTRRKISL